MWRNSIQGVQFTAHDFTDELKAANIRISMDGRSRVFDNIFVIFLIVPEEADGLGRRLEFNRLGATVVACTPPNNSLNGSCDAVSRLACRFAQINKTPVIVAV